MTLPLLTLVTFLPAAGALLLVLLPRRESLVRWVAFLCATATFLVSLPLYFRFNPASPDYQFVERAPWMPAYGISYHLGIDGISLLLVLLTTFLSALALLSSWRAVESRVKEFSITMLLLETGMLGVFVSLDLFLFYVFWEAMLIPMYLVIGVWGGENRIYAAIKFVLYTMLGSVLMLVAILALYFHHGMATGTYTFDFPVLARYVIPGALQTWLFLAFALAFAIKVPLFPFHTWLPDAHVEAPTAGSVLLAGVLLKMGTYGFIRFCLPLFPQASLALSPWIFALSVIGIIFAAVYMLWMYQRVIFGEPTREANRALADLTGREWAVLVPVLVFIVWIGVYPVAFTRPTEASVQALIAQVQAKAAATVAGGGSR